MRWTLAKKLRTLIHLTQKYKDSVWERSGVYIRKSAALMRADVAKSFEEFRTSYTVTAVDLLRCAKKNIGKVQKKEEKEREEEIMTQLLFGGCW